MSKIISVVGPTASGKTGLSVSLALHYNAEIVSVDSMQIYKNMNIGTAKVSADEMRGVPHHMIDCFEPFENCSVQKFISMARACVDEITGRGVNCVLAGGTGLYVDHLLQDTRFVEMPADEELRCKLNALSSAELFEKLQEIDPAVAARLHVNDKKRIVRSLEVYRLTGKSILHWEEQSHVGSNPLPAIMIGLQYKDRNLLYDRINTRVDKMMSDGLLDEVSRLMQTDGFLASTAAAAIGYRELIAHLRGELALSEAIDLIKQNTRRYAKRQITWFKRNSHISWIEIDENMTSVDVFNQSVEIVERNEK